MTRKNPTKLIDALEAMESTLVARDRLTVTQARAFIAWAVRENTRLVRERDDALAKCRKVERDRQHVLNWLDGVCV